MIRIVENSIYVDCFIKIRLVLFLYFAVLSSIIYLDLLALVHYDIFVQSWLKFTEQYIVS